MKQQIVWPSSNCAHLSVSNSSGHWWFGFSWGFSMKNWRMTENSREVNVPYRILLSKKSHVSLEEFAAAESSRVTHPTPSFRMINKSHLCVFTEWDLRIIHHWVLGLKKMQRMTPLKIEKRICKTQHRNRFGCRPTGITIYISTIVWCSAGLYQTKGAKTAQGRNHFWPSFVLGQSLRGCSWNSSGRVARSRPKQEFSYQMMLNTAKLFWTGMLLFSVQKKKEILKLWLARALSFCRIYPEGIQVIISWTH